MKLLFNATMLLVVLGLASCGKDSDLPEPGSLAGSWRLTKEQSMLPGPLRNETLIFGSGQNFQLFRDNSLAAQGTYSLSLAPSCGETANRQQLSFQATGPSGYVPQGAYTLQGNTLVIDQTNRCFSDGAVYTYQRVP
jgi:hypothetical protein